MNDAGPSVLTYSSNPATYANGVTIAPNTPSNSGGAVIVYSVSPPLPAGLSLNAVTGVITGTPTAVVAAANYTVTAQNSGGSTTVLVNIRVVAPPVVTPNPTTTPVLSFNGTSRHVNAGTGIALANQSFTIEFWAKRGAIGALHTAINQGVTGAGTDKVLTIGFTAANAFSFGFSADDLVERGRGQSLLLTLLSG